MGRVLFIFLDGVGLGVSDPAVNPFFESPILGNFLPAGWRPPGNGGRPETLPVPTRQAPLPFRGALGAADASLGMPGLPQSATGQTTLFTGVNGAEILGHHLYGFPGPRLRRVLLEKSILKQVVESGRNAAFLNAYGPIFFEFGESVWERPMSASSWNNRAAGLPFLTFEDSREGRALFHDFTGRTARERGGLLPLRDPEEAGAVLAKAATSHDFSIYEFFLTDKVGHTGDLPEARRLALELEVFLGAVLEHVDFEQTHVVLTSDHGNMEDMSVRSHTHNPVPVLVWGPRAERLAARIRRLEDFCPAILDEVTADPLPGGGSGSPEGSG